MRGFDRNTLFVTSAIVCAVAATPAAAQTKSFDVPAQAVQSAIAQLGRQADIQIIAARKTTRGKQANAVRGDMTVDAALAALLRGTGLTARQTGAQTFTVVQAGEASDASPVPADPSQSRSASSSVVEEASQIEEIIVTAQKREEKLSDVPISISVLRGAALDRATERDVTESLRKVAGVAVEGMNELSGGSSLNIRGVGATGSQFNGASTVGFYIDGVPFGFVKSAFVPDLGSYDLDRIEVLRGPQGTLYGASALNGVVRVLTNDPDLSNVDLKGRVLTSSIKGGDGNYRGDAVVNIPLISDKLAVRGSASYQVKGGYISNADEGNAYDGDRLDLRFKVRAQVNDRFAVVGSVWHENNRVNGLPYSNRDYDFPYSVADSSNQSKFDAYNVSATYELDKFDLSSSTSRIDYVSTGYLNLPELLGSPPFVSKFTSQITSQEILASSTGGGNFIWSVGGFFRDAKDRLNQDAGFLLCPGSASLCPIDFTDQSRSFAIFGQSTLRAWDGALELTGGMRYFQDKVTQVENVPFDGDASRPLANDSETFSALTPKLSLTWHPSDKSTMYASYSQGFRSGFNQNANIAVAYPDVRPAKPDKLTSYEIGSKGMVWGDVVRYELSVYYLNWKDTQQTLFVPIPGGSDLGGVSAVLNAVSASGFGADVSLSANPSSNLEFGANFSFNDITADEALVDAQGVVIGKGSRLVNSPKYTANAYAIYELPFLVAGSNVTLNADVSYRSKKEYFNASGYRASSDDILLVSGSIDLKPSRHWTVKAFVDNLFDVNRTEFAGNPPFQILTRPRTIGVQLEYKLR